MSLLSSLAHLFKPAPAPDPDLRAALERIVELLGPAVHSLPDFEERLQLPAEHALGYCAGLVAALPGPIEINRKAFASDPLVHALFATPDDIDQMLGRSQAVRDYLATPASWEHDHFYALLAARRQQKKQLGIVQQGEVLRSDVPQLVLYFSDQTLIEPCGQLGVTLERLRQRALDSLLHTFRSHVAALQAERAGLRADAAAERGQLSGHRGLDPDAVHTRHLAELDARLRAMGESLMPEALSQALADFLLAPEPSLRLTPHSISIDRLGVVSQEDDGSGNFQRIDFPELCTRDKRLHLVTLARIRRDEALEAVDMVRDQQHRFMLI